MSTNPFFQPPSGSSGARTIYTVLNARNASDSTNPPDYSNDSNYSNYSLYEPNDRFNYDHYDHDFHAFIMNYPLPSESSFNGSNWSHSYSSYPSFPCGSGSYAPSRSDGLYKSPKSSPHAKHSRTPSSSSSSSFSSTTPSLTFSSSSQSSPSSSPSSLFMTDNEADSDNCSYAEDEDEDMLFDATDKAQLDAFVPPQLRAAIDAAKYSSFGKFGNEICWEALPPVFNLGHEHEDREGKGNAHHQAVQIDWQPFDSYPNFPTTKATMDPVTPPPTASNSTPSASLSSEFPPLSELLPEQQEKLCAFLYKHRECVATIEQIREIADETNLTIIAVVYYLCFY